MAKVSVQTNDAAMKILSEISKGASAKVGWIGGQQYPDSGMSVAEIAMVQEFGSPAHNIPPRAPLRRTILQHELAWQRLSERLAKAVASGKAPMIFIMEGMGAVAAGDVRKTFSQITEPPLKPATIKARERRYLSKGRGKKGAPKSGIAKPLIDSGVMMNSITHEVNS